MARRRKLAGLESSADLARKVEILEQEMATQRAALDKLKQMGSATRPDLHDTQRVSKHNA